MGFAISFGKHQEHLQQQFKNVILTSDWFCQVKILSCTHVMQLEQQWRNLLFSNASYCVSTPNPSCLGSPTFPVSAVVRGGRIQGHKVKSPTSKCSPRSEKKLWCFHVTLPPSGNKKPSIIEIVEMGKWVHPRLVSFTIGSFSTSMIMEGRVASRQFVSFRMIETDET